MKKKKNSRRYIAIGIVLILAAVVVAAAIIMTLRKSRIAALSELKQQNRTLQAKLNNLELVALQLESQSNQLKARLKDLMALQEMDLISGDNIRQSRQILNQKEQAYNKLTEEYAMLSESYQELLQESLKPSPEPEQPSRRFTPEQMQEFRTNMRQRTNEALNNRVMQAKTEYEAHILQQMKDIYDDIFEIQEEARNAQGEERNRLRREMGQQWRDLSELNQAYNSYQWKTLAEEYGITNTDEFVERAQSINQSAMPFGMGFGGGRRGRPTAQPRPYPE